MRLLAWAVGVAVLTACVKTERDYQLEYAKQLAPKQSVEAPSTVVPRLPEQPPRVFTVRAYVDLDYQAQVLHSNERVTALISAASARTKDALNLELKLVSIESWNRRSERTPMQGSLAALAREDAAADVDLVLGFVSSLEIFSESQELLGAASILGKHAVVRAMDNAPEHQAITRVFTRLDDRERETLYRERKLHKETSVLLHEWGHLLGAPHDLAGDSFLNPVYAVQRARFAPMTLHVLARALELRDAKADRRARARAIGELVATAPDVAWSLEDRARALANYERIARGEDALEVEALSQRDRQLVADARRLEAKGQLADALALLEPLLARTPPVPPAHSLACQLAGMISLSAPRTRERCEAALALDETDGSAWLMLAQHQAATKDLVAARRSYVAAKDRLASPGLEALGALAAVARMLGFVTWAEQFASRAPGRAAAEDALEWASRRRKWYGLPPGTTSPAPSDEPEYLDRFVRAQNALSKGNLLEADQLIAALEKEHPALVGPLTLRCELALRRGQNARARPACEKAVALWPESLEGHYLLGVLASLERKHRACVEHLELVVAQDPTVDDAWSRLEKAYAALGDAANRERAKSRRPRP